MLKKFLSIVCVAVLSVAFVGCDAGEMADSAKDGVDATSDAAKDAAGEMGAGEMVDGTVDSAADAAKDGIDAAAGH